MAQRQLNCETCSGRADSIFCSLHGESLQMLNSSKNSNLYKKGQNLFLSGNPAFGLFCVHSGQVKVTKTDGAGKETLIRLASSGDVIGHRSLLSESPYSATATVIEDALICFVGKQTIKELIQKEPPLALEIISKISKEMGAAEDRLASMARKSVRERFAEALLLLKENFGEEDERGRVKLKIHLSREEIGSMIGAASENVIRLFTDFKKSGFLEQEGKDIYLLDIDAIENEADLGY